MPTAAIKHLLSRPVAFHPALARMCGSVTAGLMLSQAIYWSDRTRDGSGWFYKSQREWFEEIYLSRAEQESARKALRELGFMREELRGMPATVHFLVEIDRICEAFDQYAENQQTSMRKTSKPVCEFPAKCKASSKVCRKAANQSAGIQQSPLLGTEITAETTQKTSTSLEMHKQLFVKDQGNRDMVLKSLERYVESVDEDLLNRSMEACLAQDENASAEEIAHFVHEKGPLLFTTEFRGDRGNVTVYRTDIRSPGMFLVSAVAKCFEGANSPARRRRRERIGA